MSRDRQRRVGRDIGLASGCNSDDEALDHGGSRAARPQRPSWVLRTRLARRADPTAYLTRPSRPNCLRYAHRLSASCGSAMPAKVILVPGIITCGALMYCLKVCSFHVIPEFLLASL